MPTDMNVLDKHFVAFVQHGGVLENENQEVLDRFNQILEILGSDVCPVIYDPCEEWAVEVLQQEEIDNKWLAYFDLIRMRLQFFTYLYGNEIGLYHQVLYELAVTNYYVLYFQERWHEKYDDQHKREYWLQ